MGDITDAAPTPKMGEKNIIEDERAIEIPLDCTRVFLRPSRVMGKFAVQSMLRYISETIQQVKVQEIDKPIIIYVPCGTDVITVKPNGEVKVY